jgi:iron complex transport system ATP-binding protein
MLRVEDIGWRAGSTPVIEHVSFAVAPGEFVAIVGRNGAGKSTLLDIIAGLRTPSHGGVWLAERRLDTWTAVERARILAHLPQGLRIDLSMHAEALVLMGRYAHAGRWFESDDDRAIAAAAMARCDCLPFRDRTVGSLSGGERQRVLLATCLAQQARILVLDEPSTFMDVDQQLQCFSLLREEADRGTSCVAVTHDVNLALTFATRVIVMAGRTVARDIPTAAALDDPAWLEEFSGRLTVDRGRSGPWVRYR